MPSSVSLISGPTGKLSIRPSLTTFFFQDANRNVRQRPQIQQEVKDDKSRPISEKQVRKVAARLAVQKTAFYFSLPSDFSAILTNSHLSCVGRPFAPLWLLTASRKTLGLLPHLSQAWCLPYNRKLAFFEGSRTRLSLRSSLLPLLRLRLATMR